MRADVCLVLEGTYPYVAGGVSTWVQQLLEAMPDLTFSIAYIGAVPDAHRSVKYTIPPNVIEIRDVFLQDFGDPRAAAARRSTKLESHHWAVVDRFQHDVCNGRPLDLAAISPVLACLSDATAATREFAHTREAWLRITRQYEELAPSGTSFMSFFWNHRFINVSLLNLLRADLPEAKLYHAACTGYAGLLAAKAKADTGRPFLLTEHGIYLRERRIEIFNADWIAGDHPGLSLEPSENSSFFKRWWMNFFRSMAVTAYHAADALTTLFEDNRLAQVQDGAAPERIEIIGNGIAVDRFLAVTPRVRTAETPLHIGFIGRITSIKDVKTFLHAMAILRDRKIAYSAFIIGPIDEDPSYASDCRALTHALGITSHVRFTGRADIFDYFGQLDVIVLTSLSEGLPFVILEANCAGLPVVATDVGACRELLEGRTRDDRALGVSGLLTPVATPSATAAALERMAKHPAEATRMGSNGRARVVAHYDLRRVTATYRAMYERLIAGAAAPREAPAVALIRS